MKDVKYDLDLREKIVAKQIEVLREYLTYLVDSELGYCILKR
jgi:hypothetical protein